ncbi:hypothetical protein LVJ94_07210 [Pendulispora rubella]|uniref:Uncharacterized protein n=1 Tax=Pendulispora rubella TaxID=2741070 RepID=A0ABZ2LCW4_9BACT
MPAAYHIPDEPRPGRLASYTVNPFWPFMALMLGGAWIGLPWFVFNGVAMGSASLRKELLVAVAAPVVAIATALLLGIAAVSFGLSERSMPYFKVLIIAVKLLFGYWLCLSQQRSFEIYRHFGGTVWQGAALVALGAFYFGSRVVSAVAGHSGLLVIAVM